MTEWEAIRAYPLEKYAQLMREPILFDGRNCYTNEDVKKQGIDYYSVGRRNIHKRIFCYSLKGMYSCIFLYVIIGFVTSETMK